MSFPIPNGITERLIVGDITNANINIGTNIMYARRFERQLFVHDNQPVREYFDRGWNLQVRINPHTQSSCIRSEQPEYPIIELSFLSPYR
jgi:hypothetical protein